MTTNPPKGAPPKLSNSLLNEKKVSGAWPYVSTSLVIVMLDLPAATHQAVWFRTRQEDGKHRRMLMYRLTGDVYAWLTWKMERADQQWWECANGGEGGGGNSGSGLDATTRENMQALAARIPALLAVAHAHGVTPTKRTAKPPELPRPPCPLAHMEYLDQFEAAMEEVAAGGGYERWVGRKYRKHAPAEEVDG